MAQWEQKRAFLFSHPRTASNLLQRIFSGQPDWLVSDYLFFDAFQYTRDAFDEVSMPLNEAPISTRVEHKCFVKDGLANLEKLLSQSNQGCKLFLGLLFIVRGFGKEKTHRI